MVLFIVIGIGIAVGMLCGVVYAFVEILKNISDGTRSTEDMAIILGVNIFIALICVGLYCAFKDLSFVIMSYIWLFFVANLIVLACTRPKEEKFFTFEEKSTKSKKGGTIDWEE